jgi:protein ImuA
VKQAIADLARLPGVWRGGELEHVAHEVLSTGHAALDRELPGGGWPLATLSEVLHDGVGIGEVRFLFGAMARSSEGERMVAWINAPHLPYAPALAQGGIALERCMVVRPATREDALWAAEQALRSGACGAVMLWLESSLPGERRSRADQYAWLRRLQMAAQAGRSMAVLYRSTAAEATSTPAHLRVVLAREAGALTLRIPKRRGPPLTSPIVLERASALPAPARQASALVPVEAARAHPRIAA